MTDWQLKKALFNHDWLKNEYINIIDGSLNLLCSDTVDERRIKRFLLEDFMLWEEKKKDVIWLMEHFELMSSHDMLFDVEPLVNMDDQKKGFLKTLVKELWYKNNEIEKKLGELEQTIVTIDNAFIKIKGFINSVKDKPMSKGTLNEIHQRLASFLRNCRELGRILSTFPKDSIV